MSRPPRRWLDELDNAPEGARELLSAAGAPDQAARDRMWSALSRATAPGTTAGAATAAKLSSGALTTAAAKAAAAIAIVALAGASLPRRAAVPPRPTASTTPVVVVASPRAKPSLPVIVASTPVVPNAHVARPEAPLAAPPVVAPTLVVHAVPHTAPPPVHARAPLHAVRVASLAPSPVVARPFTLDDEVRALADARAALRDDPAGALSALEGVRARLQGGGVLAHERERFTVEALHRVGRSAEARSRAEAFLASAPTSTMAARVRALRDEIVSAQTIR